MESAADAKSTLLLIEITPQKSADSAQPQAGGKFCVEEVTPNDVPVGLRQKVLHLFFSQNIHRSADDFRRLRLRGGVIRNHSLLNSCLKGLMECGVDAVDGGGGEAGTLTGARFESAMLQQGTVEIPQI